MIFKRAHLIFNPFVLLILLNCTFSHAQNASSFPDSFEGVVQPCYRHRPDGKPGREIILNFRGQKFSGKGTIELECAGVKESINLDAPSGIEKYSLLLPPGAGVESSCTAGITLRSAGKKLSSSVMVPQKRQWTVYIYPHSHVDIGYTNTQENVELIHRRNLLYGIDLAKRTANYPEGSRYVWNPEVLWPVERYLAKTGDKGREIIRDAVAKGYLRLDAGYVHTNTSAAVDEELFEFFDQCRKMEHLTGKKIRTFVQIDVPGMSWGIVPVAAQAGIRYCLALNNGSDRVGLSTDLSFRPFWWIGPDGRSKVLFLQPGSYNPGAILKGFDIWPLLAGQTDSSRLMRFVKTDNPRKNFIDKYLDEKLPELEASGYYPYDIFVMSWAMADNTPIDADLPDAVKSWNEDYAFPHLIIAGASEIMSTFEKKYGDRLPELRGDFTEYWTDGLGTAASQTGMNRATKERLIQAEKLWSVLRPETEIPREKFDEAWRNVIMGTEHTWCFMDPSRQPITNDILAVKFGFFTKASALSNELLNMALSSVTDTTSSCFAVFNSLQRERNGIVRISAASSAGFNCVVDGDGKNVPCQRLSTGELIVKVTNVPAFGSKKYFLKKHHQTMKGSIASGAVLDNGLLHVGLDKESGDIVSLRLNNVEFAAADDGVQINSFRYLHGNDPQSKASGTHNASIKVLENGPLLATLSVQTEAEGCNSLVREVTLADGMPYVEITDIIDKKAVTEKEGIHIGFSFDIKDPVTHADIPWGIIETDKDQLAAGNRNWITFQRWLDISGKGKGVTFCSLDAPVFESGKISANIIGAATASPEWIKKLRPSATIWSWALNNHWHTNFPLSQEGRIVFRYRILPHQYGYDPALADRFGLDQAQPLVVAPVKAGFNPSGPVLVQPNDKLVVTLIRNNVKGDATIVRIRSLAGTDEWTTLTWPGRKPAVQSVVYDREKKVNLGGGEAILVPAGGMVTVEVKW